jgi:hypothetical protein
MKSFSTVVRSTERRDQLLPIGRVKWVSKSVNHRLGKEKLARDISWENGLYDVQSLCHHT